QPRSGGSDTGNRPGTGGEGGYQARSGGSDSGSRPGTSPGGVYQAVLDILNTDYDAIITHDRRLRVDIVEFPGVEDPIALFLDVIVNVTHDGKPLYHYIGFIEVPSVGAYDLNVLAAKPKGSLSAPNDTYFLNQWNLGLT